LFFVLLLIFHRPLLLSLGERIAVHFAAKERLKLELHLEGNVFTRLVARNVHMTTTGPNLIESIDADFVRADYSLWTLIRHGFEASLRDAEIRSARVVLNPANDTIKGPPKPADLFKIFPDRVRISDGTLIIRAQPHDFVAEHLDLSLDPKAPGELRVQKMQMVGGQSFANLTAPTSYAGGLLTLTNLALGDDRIERLKIDVSHIHETRQARLDMTLAAQIGGGKLTAAMKLLEKDSSILQETYLEMNGLDANAVSKYATLPDGIIGGRIDQLEGNLVGSSVKPDTCSGGVTAQISEFTVRQASSTAACWTLGEGWQGRLELGRNQVGQSHLQLRGSAILPHNRDDFPRSPAHFEVSSDTLDLARATETMSQHLSGSAQITGKFEIENAKINASVNVSASDVGFENGTIETVSAKISASKITRPGHVERPWFADLRTDVALEASNLRFREYVLDSVQANARSVDDLLKVEQLLMKRRENELALHGDYRLPLDVVNAPSQPGTVDLTLNAPELVDYWTEDSPDKVSGPLQINGQIKWIKGAGNGQLSIYGSNLRMRNLVFHQISSQWSMANSVVYVNDFTAALNERDFLDANGFVDLHPPYRYRGKISANVRDLSTFTPILQA
jgi:hypothetical protein